MVFSFLSFYFLFLIYIEQEAAKRGLGGDDPGWKEQTESHRWERPSTVESLQEYVKTTFGWRKKKGIAVPADYTDMAVRLADRADPGDVDEQTKAVMAWALENVMADDE